MLIDADDLALLTQSFRAAMTAEPGPGAADRVLHELGWLDALAAAPEQAVVAAFGALGATGAAATLLDDVVLTALGLPTGLDRTVVLATAHSAAVPGVLTGDSVTVAGLVSSRLAAPVTPLGDAHRVTKVVVVTADAVLGVDPALLRAAADATGGGDVGDGGGRGGVGVGVGVGVGGGGGGVGGKGGTLDPQQPFAAVSARFTRSSARELGDAAHWPAAVRLARLALAAELIAASRQMLALARDHALGRVQFGRPIASFQAVRHRLAEAFVAIESAEAVLTAGVGGTADDDLAAAVAKSLAGRAARLTATHTQQVLAGIGFTTDHGLHLLLKRTMVLDTLFGSARTLPVEIGRALARSGGAPRLLEL